MEVGCVGLEVGCPVGSALGCPVGRTEGLEVGGLVEG